MDPTKFQTVARQMPLNRCCLCDGSMGIAVDEKNPYKKRLMHLRCAVSAATSSGDFHEQRRLERQEAEEAEEAESS